MSSDDFSESLKSNKEFIAKLIEIDGRNIRFGDESILSDEKLIYEAIKRQPEAICHCYNKELITKEMALLSMDDGKVWFDQLPASLRKDKEVLQKALSIDPWLLKVIPEELQDDETIIMAAVKKNGAAIEFASERLKKNE